MNFKAVIFQADDKNLFNRAKFLQNGNCGYVLKPEYMTENDYQEPNLEVNVRKVEEKITKILTFQCLGNPLDSPSDFWSTFAKCK